jgi:acetate kinase
VLTVNAGSSTLKLRILDEDGRLICERESSAIEEQQGVRGALQAVLGEQEVDAAGHRVVHGGPRFSEPTVVDPSVEAELDRLADLAPLHNPPAVTAMRALDDLRPGLPTVACFDTAFHRTIPPAAATYAIPAEWSERWPLRRYGFHGLSHSYASRRAAELLEVPIAELRLVTAHLGAGASLAAVKAGSSVDTTMGFTPLEGLVMATRSGSVDPGMLLWVQQHGDWSAEEMGQALDAKSGLLALSRRSGDMRDVISGLDEGDEHCQLAFDVYIHHLAGGIARMAASMGGLDALDVTGGVGENSPRVREAAVKQTTFMGLEIDNVANARPDLDSLLSPAGSAVAVALVHSREDLEIASQVRATLTG